MTSSAKCFMCPAPATTSLNGVPVCAECATFSGALMSQQRRFAERHKAKRTSAGKRRRPAWLKPWMGGRNRKKKGDA